MMSCFLSCFLCWLATHKARLLRRPVQLPTQAQQAVLTWKDDPVIVMRLNFINGFCMFMLLSYLYECRKAMEPLDCTLTEAGWRSLDAVGACHCVSCAWCCALACNHFVFQEPSIKCYEDLAWTEWFPHLSFAMIGSYTVGLPLGIVILLTFGNFKKLTSSRRFQFSKAFGTLYAKYKPQYIGWEVMVMMRKLLIQVSSLFLTNNANLQSHCVLLVLLLAIVSQVRHTCTTCDARLHQCGWLVQFLCHPYRFHHENRMEEATLLLNFATLLAGLAFEQLSETSANTDLPVADILVAMVC